MSSLPSASRTIRAASFVFGLISLGWSIWVMPEFLREGPVITASERLVAGDDYSAASVAALRSRIAMSSENESSPKMRGAISIFQQWMLERSVPSKQEDAIARHNAISAITSALVIAPSDSYQWLSLYWASRSDGSFHPHYLSFLEMSYATGSLEAWVALRRNPLVLTIYPLLTPALQQAALEEFCGLIRSHLYLQAAAILASATPNTRKAIAAKIKALNLPDRESFSKAVMDSGITDIVLPGEGFGPIRPWRQ